MDVIFDPARQGTPAAAEGAIKDGNQNTFMQDVIEASREVPVLLDFWATWCAPCCREIPHLREAYAAYKAKGLEIYAVSLDNDEAKWRSFTSANDMPWINVQGIDADKRSTAAAAYGITSIPANFLISPDGIIIAKNLRGGELSKKLAEMLE